MVKIMFMSKKTKIIILIIFLCFFSILFLFLIFKYIKYNAIEVNAVNINIDELKSKLNKKKKLDVNIELNNESTYYNEKENIYYYYIDELHENSYLNLDTLILIENKYNYVILNDKYKFGNNYYLDFGEKYDILIYNDREYYETTIVFTSVPIINISINSEITTENQKSNFELYGINNNKIVNFHCESSIRTRGYSSSWVPKKSYRLTLSIGDKSLLGLREDDEWILEALYPDASKIRSKLAADLWNDINSISPNNINNDLNSEYVDLYINGDYVGLYLLKEPVDEKTLGLYETSANDSGILIKGINYEDFDKENYDINKVGESVYPFEIKYPKGLNDYSKYWDFMVERIYGYFLHRGPISDDFILNRFDVANFIDHRILIYTIMALDNYSTKNIYLSLTNMSDDLKVILTPWDLDQSFGLQWDDQSPTYVSKFLDNYKNETHSSIFISDLDEINKLIKERYFELRKSVLSIESIYMKIDAYYEQMKYSAYRDSKIWIEADIEKEIEEVKNWYKNRVHFLDEYMGDLNV